MVLTLLITMYTSMSRLPYADVLKEVIARWAADDEEALGDADGETAHFPSSPSLRKKATM
jgi:hypothetical protein